MDQQLTSKSNTHKGKESISGKKPAMLEIPIFGPKNAQLAVSLGTGRLELNAKGSYAAGGITPSLEELQSIRTALGDETVPIPIPIRIMIRPRGALPNVNEQDFIYSTPEYQAMCDAIVQFKESGLLKAEKGDGFVFGVLRTISPPTADECLEKEVEVDIEKNTHLVDLARPFKCVFHRAFDDLLGLGLGAAGGGNQPEEVKKHKEKEKERKAFEEVKQCGFDGILTSGGKGNAPDGGNKERLGRILTLANDGNGEKRVEIIVGGGVRSSNLGGLREALLGTRDTDGDGEGEGERKPECWFHSSCLTGRLGLGLGGLEFDGEEVEALVRGLSGTEA